MQIRANPKPNRCGKADHLSPNELIGWRSAGDRLIGVSEHEILNTSSAQA
jgi:hypothetical protein